MITSTLALLLATAGPALAAPSPVPAAAAVAASTSTALPFGVSTQTVSSIYTGDRVRDPFMPAAMGAKARRVTDETKSDGPEVVDIHGMQLKGILKDAKVDFALFSAETGGSYILRGGKLYNERNKLVPGITGNIKIKQKTVELITVDKDVQVFRLGEEDKDKEKR